MRKSIVFLLVVSVFCCPLMSAVYAGQVQPQQLSDTETETIATMEVNSASLMESVIGGEDDALVVAFAAVGIIVLIAAAAAG